MNDLKAVFCHDGPMYSDQFNNYYGIDLNNEYYSRYYQFVDHLTVAMRVEHINQHDAINKYSKITLKNFNVTECERLVSLKNIRKIKSILKEVDFVIVRYPSIIGDIAIKLAIQIRKPYLIEVVGCAWDSYWNHGTIRGRLFAPVMFLNMKFEIFRAKYVIYVSKRFLQMRYPTLGENVSCPDVNLETPNVENLNKRLMKIDKQNMRKEIIFGLIGSLNVKYRGHKTAIMILSKLKGKEHIYKFRFLGEGNTRKWIDMAKLYKVNNNIEFCKILPSGNSVMEWIDNIDILIMPTKAETLGRAVIEAMSRACPVIGSVETAIREQIGSDCLCKADDYGSIVKIIEKMMENREYMKYCALENFYRSFKYSNSQTSLVRNQFYKIFFKSIMIER